VEVAAAYIPLIGGLLVAIYKIVNWLLKKKESVAPAPISRAGVNISGVKFEDNALDAINIQGDINVDIKNVEGKGMVV
jgi:hypothetical protein